MAVENAVVLDEAIDKDYEPSRSEVVEYAEWLGIDIEKDEDLLWIAKAGLKAPLPPPWKPCQTGSDGEIFYFNFESGESVWDHPCDEYHRHLFAKEYAKKYGLALPSEDGPPSDSEADVTPRRASPAATEATYEDATPTGAGMRNAFCMDDDNAKSKKDKKDKKKDKKEKKEKKHSKELAPLSVPALKSLGTGLAVGIPLAQRERDMDLESSLEDSLDPDDGSEEKLPIEVPVLQHDADLDKSLTSTSELKSRSALKSLEDVLGGSISSGGALLPVAEEPSECPEDIASENTLEAKIRKEREASVRQRLEKSLQEWTKQEEAKQDEEIGKKKLALDAETKRELEKHRRDMKEELDMERDKIFAELQAKHDKEVNEERQRLKKAFTTQKGVLQQEAEKEAEELKWKDAQIKALEESTKKLEEELSSMKLKNSKLEEDLKVAKAEAASTAEQAASTTAKLQSWEAEMQRLKSVAATGDETTQKELLAVQSANKQLSEEKETLVKDTARLGQELTDARREIEIEKEKLDHLQNDNRASADLIKQLQEEKHSVGQKAKDDSEAKDQEELEDLRSQAEVLSSEFAKSVEKCQHLEQENERLEKEAAENYAMAAKTMEAQEMLKTKEAQLGSVSAELKITKQEVASANQDRDALQKEIELLRADTTHSTTSLQAQAESASHLQKELQSLRSQLDSERSDLLQAREESSSLAREASKIKLELEAKQGECQSLRDAASANSQTHTDSLDHLQKECQRLRDVASESSKTASESMQGLQKKYDEECKVAAQAKADAAGAARELSMLRAELGSRTTECERLHAKLAEGSNRSSDEVQNLQSQLTDERSQTAQARAEVVSISRELAVLKTEVGMRARECESLQAKAMTSSRAAQEDLQRSQSQLSAQLRESQDESQRVQSQLSAQLRELTTLRIEFDAKDAECKRAHERIAESSGISADEIRRLKTQLDEERRCTAQARAEATSTACELSSLRVELETRCGVTEEMRKLQKELDEERRAAASLRTETASASCELATLRAELDTRSSECGRLRAEAANGSGMASEELRRLRAQLDDEREAFAKLKVEASSSARELLTTRSELETLQQQANRPAAIVASEEERLLRGLIREREDDIFRLKADMAEAATSHNREMDSLRARLAESRGRQQENQMTAVNDMQVQLRERAGEIEKLHGEIRASTSEIERLKCEARNLEIRAASSETAAVESAKASTSEQWRRDVQRMEELVRQRDVEIASARDQSERMQREIRRQEVDEHRSTQRLEEVRADLERSRQETQQLKEDVAEAERRLEDFRASLRGEHASRSLAESQAREAQREVRDLRDQLQHQAVESEVLANEARKERQALASNEAEMTRMQQLIHSKEAELRQVRSSTEVQSLQAEATLRRRSAELNNREQALGDRERHICEHEALLQEAEDSLRARRRELEVVGLRTMANEFAAPQTISRRTRESAAVQTNSPPGRKPKLEDVDSAPIDVVPPLGLDYGEESLRVPAGASSDEGEVVDTGTVAEQEGMRITSPLGSARDLASMGEAMGTLDARRRELRRERADLEELRRQWKRDLLKVQMSGGSAGSQAVLRDIKGVLDERFASLNNLIEEHRVLERAASAQRTPRMSRKSPADSVGTDGFPAKALTKVQPDTGGATTPKDGTTCFSGTRDSELVSRWQHLLSPSMGASSLRSKSARPTIGTTPRGTIGERSFAHYRQKAKASRALVDQHLNWLSSFQREVTAGRPLSARGAPRYGW